jgi:hypothetical protein
MGLYHGRHGGLHLHSIEVTGFTLDEIDHILLGDEQVPGVEVGPCPPRAHGRIV